MSDLETPTQFIEQYLTEVVNDFNEKGCQQLFTPENADLLSKAIVNLSLGTHTSNWCRMSSIGKPSILTAVNKLKQDFGQSLEHDESDDINSPRMQSLFLWGNVFEEWLILIGERLGWWKVVSQQQELAIPCDNGAVITGHIDAVLECPEGQFVLEVKTLSPNYHRTFVKSPNDDRGYLTQLAMYSDCTKLPGFWLALDKGSGCLSVVNLPSYADERIERALKITNHVSKLTTIEEVVTTVPVPPPVEEIFKRKPTGRYLLPDSMKFYEYADIFYVLENDSNGYKKDTVYVADYREHAEVIDLLTQRLTS
ncbi:Cas4-domain exonuclease [Anabaena phage A-4L]|uniref:Uncharacterized protein n=1 Tax=Anabaena phage A-4L TaxID=1357732 RepID=A0A059PY90_9CAUD|nr:Cas4-domain exonuclease [Anabaena phage A-4L]AGR48550.1 hypothetical protein A4L_23 [Anabaena phage A-4L]